MNTEHATAELFAALSVAQGEIENAEKNSKNPHFNSRYADLAEILNTIRPVFSKNGLSVVQSPAFDGTIASVTTILAHKTGGYIMDTASCVPKKADGQGIGDATTYLRRYSVAAFAGIAQEDDDGNKASHDNAAPQQPRQASPNAPVAPTQAKTAPKAPAVGQNPVVDGLTYVSDVRILSVKEISSKDPNKPWTGWFFTLNNGMEVGTFDSTLAAQATGFVAKDGSKPVDVEVMPGKKPGKIELTYVKEADDVPMQ